jgi:two-component system, sensor histidine kinase and response regulator
MESAHTSQHTHSILIVEDDKAARDILGVVISKKYPDITLYFAENGRTGVDLFKEKAPEIVITDVNMPVMDGIQMAREIKALKADTMFIVITAYSDRNISEKFIDGFTSFIKKPIQFAALFEAINKCIADNSTRRE